MQRGRELANLTVCDRGHQESLHNKDVIQVRIRAEEGGEHLPSGRRITRTGVAALGSLLAGRRRYARAIAVFGEIVALYARYRLRPEGRSLSDVHKDAADRVTELCRRNGAIWVKAAQFFSCRPDVLPLEYIQSLQTLQNEGMSVPFRHVEQALRRAWGSSWRTHFEEFSEIPVAVASIAQVHRARLAGGQEVAVKVRLPGVVELFEQDARVFRFLAELVAPFFRQLDFPQITEQLLEMTAVEMDFRNEAQNLERFARIPHPPRIRVPVLHTALSAANVLVTNWEEGVRLREHLDANPDQAADLLTLLFGSYLQQVTRVGLYQADPHPGNFIVGAGGDIVILDFGAIGKLTPQEVRNYSRLLYGLMGFLPGEDIGQLFVDAGFVGGRAETLKDLALYVLSDRMNGNNNVAYAMEDIIEKFRENHVRIPDTYIGIARVLITLGGLLMHYKVPQTIEDHRAAVRNLLIEHGDVVDAQQAVLLPPDDQCRRLDILELVTHLHLAVDVVLDLFGDGGVGGLERTHLFDEEIRQPRRIRHGPVHGHEHVVGFVRDQRVITFRQQGGELGRQQGDAGGIDQSQ